MLSLFVLSFTTMWVTPMLSCFRVTSDVVKFLFHFCIITTLEVKYYLNFELLHDHCTSSLFLSVGRCTFLP